MNLNETVTNESLATLPSTATYIGYHSSLRPEDVAVVENDREITYGAFYRDIGKMVTALDRFGLEPGQVAGVEHPSFYLQWLVVLAFEALGVCTFSYHPDEIPVSESTLAALDLVTCSPGREPENTKRVHVMDQNWIDSVSAENLELPMTASPIGPDSPLRIVKSSGTTGSLKRMIHTWRVHEFWIGQYLFRTGFNRHSRFLLTMGFNIQAFHAYATACIRVGGTCVRETRESVDRALVEHAITHVTFLPISLIPVLNNLPENYVKTPDLTIFTIGAPVSEAVRSRVKRKLANDLIESYGTNEIAAICTVSEDGQGAVMPDVLVEVVDANGLPIIGTPGQVRVMSEGSVAGYIDDPEATRHVFRDGWFYPGDMAVMKDKRTLKLIGRADDLLNIRGIKLAPHALEEKLKNNLPVDDLCLTTIADEEGVAQLWVIVVPRDPDGLQDIALKIKPLLPAMFGEFNFVSQKNIPRTASGKVRRNELNLFLEQFQKQLPTNKQPRNTLK